MHYMIPSLVLYLLKNFSLRLQVVLIDSCSVNHCIYHFVMLVGGGDLRVFLLYHLGYSLNLLVIPMC